MNYIELLKQRDWFIKCNQILQRDKHKCQDCGCIGYHNGTIYSTESLDEVNTIINEKILIGDTFSSLIEQTFSGYTECDKVNLTGKYIDSNEKICPANEMEKNRSIQGYVRWEPYQNVKIEKQELLGDLYINKISLYKKDGFYFSDFFEMFGYTNIVTQKHIDSFDFKLHRYRKRVLNSDGSYTSYPMAILLFEQNLSNKYFICIENDSISLTYKNYVFFVSLSSSQFLYKGLNVHHEYYINGHKPWEYEDQALVTLCEKCHGKRHESNVPKYRSFVDKQIECYCKKCDRCGGTGYLPQYNHIQNGICFKCGGEGVIVDKL